MGAVGQGRWRMRACLSSEVERLRRGTGQNDETPKPRGTRTTDEDVRASWDECEGDAVGKVGMSAPTPIWSTKNMDQRKNISQKDSQRVGRK